MLSATPRRPDHGVVLASQHAVEQEILAGGGDEVVDHVAPLDLAIGADAFDLVATGQREVVAAPGAAHHRCVASRLNRERFSFVIWSCDSAAAALNQCATMAVVNARRSPVYDDRCEQLAPKLRTDLQRLVRMLDEGDLMEGSLYEQKGSTI
jgi:hypothetical protein